MEQNPTDDELRSYLLGELPEPQADALEERILKDDELFDLVEGLEADLLDAASRGELAPAERKRVLERLASSLQGRGRLALARSLSTVANEGRVVPFRPRLKPAFQWVSTLAATGLLAAVGLSLYTQVEQPATPDRGNFSWTIADQSPPPNNPALPGSESETPVIGTSPTPEPTPAPDQRADTSQETPKARPELVKAVLALALTSLRSEGEEVAKLPLQPNTDVAEITVYFEETSQDPGPFSVTVRSKEGGTIWNGSGLKARGLDVGRGLVLDVPAKHLKPGRYEVVVIGSFAEPEGAQELDIIREDH